MELDLSIDLTLPQMPGALKMSNLSGSVKMIANAIQEEWVMYSRGVPMPDGRRILPRSGNYQKSILWTSTGEFSAQVYSNCPYAIAIEEGRPARDLKEMLNTSMKVRRTKSGKRYLIIPFRWGTQNTVGFGANTMNKAEYEIVRSLDISRVTGMTTRISGQDRTTPIPQQKYQWAGRTGRLNIADHGDVFQSKIGQHMQGMVRMQNPERAGNRDTQYLTFRVMMEGSDKWHAKAQAGKFPLKQAVDKFRPIAEKAFSEALRLDIQRALQGG